MDEILGIVLYSIEYKEKGKIVYLYTKYGIMGVRVSNVLNAKSKNLAFCNTLNIVSFVITKQEFPLLKEYSLLNSSYELAINIEKMNICYTIVKILKNIKCDSLSLNERYLTFTISIINQLKESVNPKGLLAIFLIKSLKMFGVEPFFSYCINCHKEKTIFLSIRDGGVLCANCTKENNYDTIYYDFINIYSLKNNYNSYVFKTNLNLLLDNIKIYYEYHAFLKIEIK